MERRIVLHAGDAAAERVAPVEIAAERERFVAAEVEQVLDMAHDGVHARAAEKVRVEVHADHAAAVADGAEEVVREVSRVRADGAAVRV